MAYVDFTSPLPFSTSTTKSTFKPVRFASKNRRRSTASSTSESEDTSSQKSGSASLDSKSISAPAPVLPQTAEEQESAPSQQQQVSINRSSPVVAKAEVGSSSLGQNQELIDFPSVKRNHDVALINPQDSAKFAESETELNNDPSLTQVHEIDLNVSQETSRSDLASTEPENIGRTVAESIEGNLKSSHANVEKLEETTVVTQPANDNSAQSVENLNTVETTVVLENQLNSNSVPLPLPAVERLAEDSCDSITGTSDSTVERPYTEDDIDDSESAEYWLDGAEEARALAESSVAESITESLTVVDASASLNTNAKNESNATSVEGKGCLCQ